MSAGSGRNAAARNARSTTRWVEELPVRNARVLQQFGDRRLSPIERMGGMADGDDPLAETDLGAKSAILRHLGENCDVDTSIDDGGHDIRPVADLDANLDLRVEPLERGYQRHPRHRVAETDAQFTSRQLLALLENRHRIGFHRLDPVGRRIELTAQRGRHQAVPMPVKKPDVIFKLELAHQLRDRRLRDAETSCRSRKVSSLKYRVHGAHARRRQSHINSSPIQGCFRRSLATIQRQTLSLL